jgi:hypothetical protein
VPNVVDFQNVSTAGLESSPVADALAGEATEFVAAGIRMAYVFYESGLSINVLYALKPGGKRAVGSKLAGTIRGSYFVIKGEY